MTKEEIIAGQIEELNNQREVLIRAIKDIDYSKTDYFNNSGQLNTEISHIDARIDSLLDRID